VAYNTRKATVRPEGELKAQIDALDKELADATRLGKTGEVRRLIAKGQTLLAGRAWTDVIDFTNSVVIRTEQVIADSSKPYAFRIEQIYSPAIELPRTLTAQVRLQKRRALATASAELVKDLGKFDGVSRDLRESPHHIEVDVNDVPNGTYQLEVEIFDDARSLGTTTLAVNLYKGLDALVAQLEDAASRAPEDLGAEIRFPVDRMRNVNRGRLELRTFDPEKDFAAAQNIVAAVRAGKDPFKDRTGDFKRHYLLQSAGEIMPYRMYVPAKYAASRPFPLIIALHGLGGTEDSLFENYDRTLAPLAEKHGYIVAAPLGYRVDGGYGLGIGPAPNDPISRRSQQLSEDDVMEVLKLVRQQYNIDADRIYLMGHSLGAIGTWKIAPKFPDIWAALGPIAGVGSPATLERIRHVPQIVVHGDDDRTVSVQGSRAMVAKMKELGIEHKYIEVPGGSHGGVVAPNLSAIFEFFNTHKKGS
jgi:poly(3-hydroxybutyrate) depolymerase